MPKKSSPAIKKGDVSPAEYTKFITSLKVKIRSAQIKAAITVNSELIKLYWEIGKEIFEKQEKGGWGGNILEKAAKELQNEFPGVEGFSRRNMFRMKAFYQAYAKVPQLVAQLDSLPVFFIPWGHNALILEKIKDTAERLWYAAKTIEHGWSRSMLTIWIENDLYRREGKAITNFKAALPAPQSDLAQQSLKDPYVFDFLTLHKAYLEKDLEDGLVKHIQKFLIELGQGFAFVGQQYPVKAGKKDLYIDLLFYHLNLRCYVIVELKAGEFDSRDAGQLSNCISSVKANWSEGYSSSTRLQGAKMGYKDRLSIHRLEKDRTLQILKKRLPSSPAVILDVGGAAGVYAFPLAETGYEVHLIDPIAVDIEQAKEHAKKTGMNLASYAVGDARNIEQPDNSANVVLFFGPLYHLIEEKDRLKALREAYRVLKPGGILFAAGIARFASLMDAMHKGTLYSKIDVIKQDFATGIHRKISEDITFTYLHRPEDLKKEMASSGFKDITICSIEGPVWEKQVIKALQKDEKGWATLLALLEKIEAEETIIGASAHIMAIGNVGLDKP